MICKRGRHLEVVPAPRGPADRPADGRAKVVAGMDVQHDALLPGDGVKPAERLSNSDQAGRPLVVLSLDDADVRGDVRHGNPPSPQFLDEERQFRFRRQAGGGGHARRAFIDAQFEIEGSIAPEILDMRRELPHHFQGRSYLSARRSAAVAP